MSERSETESERDLETIDVVVGADSSSKRSSLKSNQGKDESIKGVEEEERRDSTSDQVLLASAYLHDACKGHHMEFQPTVPAVNLYLKFRSWPLEGCMYAVVVAFLSLALFEEPAVPPIALPFHITVVVEFFCLTFFLFRLGHEYLFSKKEGFWKDGKHIMTLVIIILTVVDICIYTGLTDSGLFAVRLSRPLRPFIIVNIPEGRHIRRAFRNIRRTLPEIGSVLVLFGLILVVFALMAYKIFSKRGWKKVNGDPYFYTFLDSYWDLYVLVTTANNPDIMMPAYNKNPWLCLFFIVFIIICLYIFMSIFLAVVYNNYRSNLKNEVKVIIKRKRELLTTVFNLMKDETIDGKEVIKQDQFYKLLKLTVPRKSEQYFKVVWCVLDADQNGFVDREEFMCVADLLNIPVTEVLPNLFERYMPKVYRSKYSSMTKAFVKHRAFRYMFDAIIVANAFFILFDVDGGEWAFLAIFIVEILLKVYTFGFYMFLRKLWNIFDVLVIGAAFLMSVAEEVRGDKFDSGLILDVMLVLRVLRLVKIFHSLDRFKTILNTIMHILPSMVTYAGVLFVFFYFFAVIGIEAFHGRIEYYGYDDGVPLPEDQRYCGNPNLANSEFYRQQYCANNFNHMLRAFVVLFELLVVNQWHVIADGYHLAVGSAYTRIYFIAFHCLSVIIILNIFTAFVLEVFVLEFSFSKGKLESKLEAKINEMGLGLGSRPLWQQSFTGDESTIVNVHPGATPGGRGDGLKVGGKKPVDMARESILDYDELDSAYVDADHDNLQFVSQQLEEIVHRYVNYSHETAIRFHLHKQGRDVHTLLEKLFIKEIEEKPPQDLTAQVIDEVTIGGVAMADSSNVSSVFLS